MNVYIMTDIEGISGIYARDQVSPGQARFDEGRRYMTRDVNICAEACKRAGVEKIYVRDAHGGSNTLIWDKLSDAVDIIVSGMTADVRYAGLDDCDAVILLGYHAMAGTENAVLEHTMSSGSVQNVRINGIKMGEIALDAAIAAEYGKPIIMVSGDTAACNEAKEFLPWVTAVEVKKSVSSCFGAQLYSASATKQKLEQGIADAIRAFREGRTELYRISAPLTMQVEYTERTPLPSHSIRPYAKHVDGRTLEMTAESVEEALYRI